MSFKKRLVSIGFQGSTTPNPSVCFLVTCLGASSVAIANRAGATATASPTALTNNAAVGASLAALITPSASKLWTKEPVGWKKNLTSLR